MLTPLEFETKDITPAVIQGGKTGLNWYFIGGNGLMNGILCFFSALSISETISDKEAVKWSINGPMLVAAFVNFLLTAAAYDGTVDNIADCFRPDRGSQKSKTIGLLSGLSKGVTGYVASYGLLYKIVILTSGDKTMHSWYLLAAIACSIPYTVMETNKITTKLNQLVDRWEDTLQEYQDLSATKKFYIVCHWIATWMPATLALSIIALSFNQQHTGAQFWITLTSSFLFSALCAIGPTHQYSVYWTQAEKHKITADTEYQVLADADSDQPITHPLSANIIAGIGVIAKFALTLIGFLLTSLPFDDLHFFKENLNLHDFHNLSSHEFNSSIGWGSAISVAAIVGIGYCGVQFPRLATKAAENLSPYIGSFCHFFKDKITPHNTSNPQNLIV